VWIVGYVAVTALVAATLEGAKIVGDVVYVVPIAAAAGLAFLAAGTTAGLQRRLWTVLAISNAVWLAGELIWGWYGLILDREPPFPSTADAFYLTSYVLASRRG
jgi:hypothetical protein